MILWHKGCALSIALVKTKDMKRLLILILLCVPALLLQAQNEGEITGKVINAESKDGMPFAHLILYSNNTKVMEIESDLYGIYNFKLLQPAIYDISVLYVGYDTVLYTGVVVGSDDMVYLDIPITPGYDLPIFEYIEPLVNKNNPQSEVTIPASSLRQQAIDDVIDAVVNVVPTVQQNDKTGGLYIGGSREDATLYVVDGVKVIGSLYVPLNAIKEVTVITSGIPAAYGDFMGGVVEITTKGYAGIYWRSFFRLNSSAQRNADVFVCL